MINETEAAARAQRINTRMRALGVPFKDAHGYQALAASEGFPDWNRMRAAIRRATGSGPSDIAATQTAVGEPGIADTTGSDPAVPAMVTSSLPGVAAAQPRVRRTHWLIASPGSGKSTMLALRLLAEMERPDGAFLLVDLAGRFEDLPDPIREVAAHVRITLESDSGAGGEAVHGRRLGPVPDGVRGVVVTFERVHKRGGRTGPELIVAALRKLPMLLDGAVPRALLESMTLLCFDAVHPLREEAGSVFFNELLPFFESGGADVVVSTQTIEARIALTHRIGRRIICDPIGPHGWQNVKNLLAEGVTMTEMAELVARPPSVDDDAVLMEAIAAAVSISLASGHYGWSESSRSTRFQALLKSRSEARTRRFGATEPRGKPLEQFTEPPRPVTLRGFALPVESEARQLSRLVRLFLDQLQSAGVLVEGAGEIAAKVRLTHEHWRADLVVLATTGSPAAVRFLRKASCQVEQVQKVCSMFTFPEELATRFVERVIAEEAPQD